MNIISRGIRNAFRNAIRTFSIIAILGLVIGLSFVMLIANHAVSSKIESVKESVGNTITIRPVGSGGPRVINGLSESQLDKIRDIAHIKQITETLNGSLTTEGTNSAPPGATKIDDGVDEYTTNLKSTIAPNDSDSTNGNGLVLSNNLPDGFSFPIEVTGTSTPLSNLAESNSKVTLEEGKAIDATKDSNDVMVSVAMAEKNDLKVGSTFSGYNETLTVVGIFETDTESGKNVIIMSLPALQRLSDNKNAVTQAVVTVDSAANIGNTADAIKDALGAKNADVTSGEDAIEKAIQPLKTIQSLSLYSLIGSVMAGSVIILLVMVMIVRERRREIGVIKAIGGSNVRVMFQFMIEAITLTLLGVVVGLIIGVIAGSPATNALVENSSETLASPLTGGMRLGGPDGLTQSITNVQAQVGWVVIFGGLGAAMIIALIGSAAASFFIAKVKPAEVLRSE